MTDKRKVEVFSAGCPVCEDAVKMVKGMACSSCEVTVLDMNESCAAERAKALGIGSLPAIVVDGALVDCCTNRGPREDSLKKAGIGQAV